MPAEIYAPFFDATCNVFSLMLDLSDVTARPADGFPQADSLGISVGVTGDLTGEVIYRFPRDTSLHMVSILSGMELEEVDGFVASVLSEMAHIISSNVLSMLSARDVRCDLLPPVLTDGGDAAPCALSTECCLSTSAGPVCLDIRLHPTVGGSL